MSASVSAGGERMIITTTIVGHLFKALRRSLSRVFLWFLVTGLIAAVVTEIIAIIITGGLPNLYANGVALALGLAIGYAAGLMTLVWEVFHDLIETVEDLGRDFTKELTAGTGLVEKVIETVERRI
jgi:uncharacterized membrane protein